MVQVRDKTELLNHGVQSRLPLRKSAFAWLLTLPLIFFAAQGNFSFEYGGSGRSLGVFGYVVIPVAAYGAFVWDFYLNSKRVMAVLQAQKLILLLPAIAMASALWSQDPFRSFYNGVFLLVDTLFAFYLVIRFRPERLMELMMLAGAIMSVLGLIMVYGFPGIGTSFTPRVYGAWIGLFMDRTTSASVNVFLLSPAIVLWRKNFTFARLVYIVLQLVFIVKAQAASAIIVLLAYASTVFLLRATTRLPKKTLLILSFIILPVVIVGLIVITPLIPQLLEAFGRDPTLTGRTEIWGTLLRSVDKQPLLGYGYYAFWNGLAGESASVLVASQWIFGYAHNGYLEVVLQLGLIGLAAFFATVLQGLRDAWTCYRRDLSVGTLWFTSLIFLTLYYNVSEETLIWPNSLRWILYVVGTCGLMIAAKEVSEQQPQLQTAPPSYESVPSDALA